MTRTLLPFQADDISALARALNRQIAEIGRLPGHVEMLNMLARAGGFRNFQHFRASPPVPAVPGAPSAASASPPAAVPPEAAPAIDEAALRRLASLFDPAGRLISWPAGLKRQGLCLWVVWAGLPSRRTMTEKEVNQALNALHLFGDAAILRRTMCNAGMMTRKPDGSDYRRVERRPPADALALIHRLAARAGAGA